MINFSVGPVQSCEEVRAIGAEQVPYFRTKEFSLVMMENERLVKQFAHAPEGARVVFLTGSGTASMEAAVMNTLSRKDRAIVINGGSFGQRFQDLLEIHDIPHAPIRLAHGESLSKEKLYDLDGQGYTALLVNVHETSTGVLYDIQMISEFCKRNGIFLIVDAISSFLADSFDMAALGVDVMIAGSQKALACPPGISFAVLSSRALERVNAADVKSMYLNMKSALKDGERGQTPFTPAVGILRQINARLRMIDQNGGVDAEVARAAELAAYFRERIVELPFDIVSSSMSNAVTPLHPKTASARVIFETLKDEYGIWVCPNGEDMKETIFRVGHIGALCKGDYDTLLSALRDMQKRGLL